GAPLLAVRVLPEAELELEGLAAVARAEDGARLGAGPDGLLVDARRQLPHPLEGGAGVGGEADLALLPRGAQVVGAEHPRSGPARARSDEEARLRTPLVDHAGVDLLHVAERPGPLPLLATGVGTPDPQALARPDHEQG